MCMQSLHADQESSLALFHGALVTLKWGTCTKEGVKYTYIVLYAVRISILNFVQGNFKVPLNKSENGNGLGLVQLRVLRVSVITVHAGSYGHRRQAKWTHDSLHKVAQQRNSCHVHCSRYIATLTTTPKQPNDIHCC